MQIYDTTGKGIVLKVFDRSRKIFRLLNPGEPEPARKNIGGRYCYAEEGTGEFYFSEDHFKGLFMKWSTGIMTAQVMKQEARAAAEETVNHNRLAADYINLIQRFICAVFVYGKDVEKISRSMSTGKYY